jgi:hypothetical protein
MNAYKVDAIVTEDGLAILEGLPLPVGSSVEVIILDNGMLGQVSISDRLFDDKSWNRCLDCFKYITTLYIRRHQ